MVKTGCSNIRSINDSVRKRGKLMRGNGMKWWLAGVAALALIGCGQSASNTNGTNTSVSAPSVAVVDETTRAANDEALAEWFAVKWQEGIARSPQFKTQLGMIDETYSQWDDPSNFFDLETLAIAEANLAELQASFDPETLSENAALSYRLYVYQTQRQLEGRQWRNNGYVFSHFYGAHTGAPAFLMNMHRINTIAHAEAYIGRLEGMDEYLLGLLEQFDARAARGVVVPAWSLDKMIEAAGNVVTGAPFDQGPDSSLLADFKGKIAALDISQDEKDALIERAKAALISDVAPAYAAMSESFRAALATAAPGDGVWKLPQGDEFYDYRLRMMTTTDYSAAEIHDIGLREVDRIHGEMRAIMQQVGFEGDLAAFFEFMRTDPRFYLPSTDEGRAEYMAVATSYIDDMRGRLDELFTVKPQADMVVKRVEPFREKSAGKAFYQRPAIDGSRPGTYYANLRDMADMPTYQAEALAYHEGIPGHHMQIAIAQELTGIPSFRKFGGYTAYSEGWGLYSEYIPKEMGLYADPYSDFGRLAMELWRAARLVVDTGLHDKQWTREEAIAYLITNTPNPPGDCEAAIERYSVLPGQATAYMIGKLKIMELRANAEAELGEHFDIRGFHDTLLANGAVPLDILEELVGEWIKTQKPA
jgi:uncharacterized protein (DUF885 family)